MNGGRKHTKNSATRCCCDCFKHCRDAQLINNVIAMAKTRFLHQTISPCRDNTHKFIRYQIHHFFIRRLALTCGLCALFEKQSCYKSTFVPVCCFACSCAVKDR